ncbi:MAG: acyl-ACP desaturase, partial [Nocardioidaceae bacterium]|nr:acyl-ACP desaturase [Nocardioidaceae bacterium]
MTLSAERTLTETEFLLELNPVVEAELNRHIPVAKEWFP